jgi:hypothetical protein
MDRPSNELTVYRITQQCRMKLEVARSGGEWMNDSNQGFANRCLPMRIANQAGWVVLNDRALRAKWMGGNTQSALMLEQTGAPPYAAISHFGEGILTFKIPFLFRTPPGVALLFRGPANAPKDSIAPLEGLVETDWAVATASVNWKFTRTDTWVEFAQGEPICMVVPLRLDLMENLQPHVINIESDPETNKQYQIWSESTRNFNQRLRSHEPEAVKLGWQRYYLRGTAPHAESEMIAKASDHRTRLNLKEFVDPIAS